MLYIFICAHFCPAVSQILTYILGCFFVLWNLSSRVLSGSGTIASTSSSLLAYRTLIQLTLLSSTVIRNRPLERPGGVGSGNYRRGLFGRTGKGCSLLTRVRAVAHSSWLLFAVQWHLVTRQIRPLSTGRGTPKKSSKALAPKAPPPALAASSPQVPPHAPARPLTSRPPSTVSVSFSNSCRIVSSLCRFCNKRHFASRLQCNPYPALAAFHFVDDRN